jgi:hypothetical protein
MPEFDPETFEAEKYRDYFTDLQRAYRSAFEAMSESHDSELVHAIDQQVLNESEPFFEDGDFRVELPDAPTERVTAVAVDDEDLRAAIDRYVETLEAELRAAFGVEGDDDGG